MLGDLARIYAEVYSAALKTPGFDPAAEASKACRNFIAFLEESKIK